MKVLKFDLTTFEDLHVYNLTTIINNLFDFIQAKINKGNVISIERRYSNAEPDIVLSIRTQDELQQFRNRQF